MQWIIAEFAMKYCAAKIALNYSKYRKQMIAVFAFIWTKRIEVKVLQILQVKFVKFAFILTNNNVMKVMQILKEKIVKFAFSWTNNIAVKIMQTLKVKLVKFALD